MAITESPADKYAFLFTGPAELHYLTDLQNVFQTITEYYNYPAANITVVLGSDPAVAPSFPGATLVKITTEAQLTASLTAFASNASGPTASGIGSKTALLYFTGRAKLEGVSKLVIDGGDGSNNVDSDWLKAILSTFQNCHVNVVMQQGYSGGFKSAFTDPALTLAQWSFTSACSDAEDSFTDESGGFFTNGWVRGLKLEALPDDTPNAGEYADELGSVGDDTDRLVSLQ
ncbi:MAG: hypothetical protein LUQ44_04695, partial [Methanothrix sp.]|nr:hypothetical protein [Methanothrix sp.]